MRRLERVKPKLEGTKFSYSRENGHVDATCPWGNRIRCHAPDAKTRPVYEQCGAVSTRHGIRT